LQKTISEYKLHIALAQLERQLTTETKKPWKSAIHFSL
jgi:hypothetical protein